MHGVDQQAPSAGQSQRLSRDGARRGQSVRIDDQTPERDQFEPLATAIKGGRAAQGRTRVLQVAQLVLVGPDERPTASGVTILESSLCAINQAEEYGTGYTLAAQVGVDPAKQAVKLTHQDARGAADRPKLSGRPRHDGLCERRKQPGARYRAHYQGVLLVQTADHVVEVTADTASGDAPCGNASSGPAKTLLRHERGLDLAGKVELGFICGGAANCRIEL